jgi:hypothetical protein
MIPHNQQAEIDSRLPQSRNESRAVSWKCVLYSLVRPNSSRIDDLEILINFRIYRFLREKSPFFCDGREWSFLLKTIILLNRKVMSLHLLIKSIQFFDPPEDVARVRPRCSRENWTLVNKPRPQPLKVLFLPRINQIWPAQSPHCPSDEISVGDFSERKMIILMIPGQISGYQTVIRYSLESFSGL